MFWIKYVRSLLQALNENTSPDEIAAGFVLGSLIGLIPKTNLIALALWCLVLLLQVNISMAMAAIVIFAIGGHFIDPVSEKIGFNLLARAYALKGLWTALYNMPIVPFTNFNNTLVLGNLVV